MSLPTSTIASSLSTHGVDNLSHQELVEALNNASSIKDVDDPTTPASYWLFDMHGRRLSTAPYSHDELRQLRAAVGGGRDPLPNPAPRVEDGSDKGVAGLEGTTQLEIRSSRVAQPPTDDGSDKENAPPVVTPVVQRDAERAVYEAVEGALREFYPAEQPFLITATDSDDPRETPFVCNTLRRPLYRQDVQVNVEDAPQPAVHLRFLSGNGRHAPHGYKHNRGEDFIHYPITDVQGVTWQATFVQAIMGPGPAEVQVRKAGKPHYAPEDMYAFMGGHSNQHRVDRAVNELKDVSLKAELALGGVQGELTRSKFRLEMANTWDRITENLSILKIIPIPRNVALTTLKLISTNPEMSEWIVVHRSQVTETANMLKSITSGEEFGFQDVEDEGPDSPGSSDGPLVPAPPVRQSAKPSKALDILHLFIEIPTDDGKVQRVCSLCRETYGDNKNKLTKDIPNYFYAKSTGTSNLCCHLCLNCHDSACGLLLYGDDSLIVENKWPYPLLTQLNVVSAHQDRTLRDPNLPPFSLSSFLEHLVRFIVADDQLVCVIECPKFRQLLMVLREILVDANIPKRDKMREAVMSHWKKSFKGLKLDLSVV
ncbi:hypothetical protein EDB85DRAFT_2142326 [Lactarius pseudohatsudake]|nr:hypothetical protein EDB85DRAFT_2142326 [Lactarius pseudohatsudake]